MPSHSTLPRRLSLLYLSCPPALLLCPLQPSPPVIIPVRQCCVDPTKTFPCCAGGLPPARGTLGRVGPVGTLFYLGMAGLRRGTFSSAFCRYDMRACLSFGIVWCKVIGKSQGRRKGRVGHLPPPPPPEKRERGANCIHFLYEVLASE